MWLFFDRYWLKSISGLFINFSAGYFMLSAITPNLTKLSTISQFLILFQHFFYGTMFLWLAVKIEQINNYE